MLLAGANGASVEEAVFAGKQDASPQVVKWIEIASRDKVTTLANSSDQHLQEYILQLAKEIDPNVKPMYAKSCSFPWSFILGIKIALDAVSVKALQRDPETFDVFTFAIRRNIMLGGDSCGRAPLIAGLLVSAGFKPLPSWGDRCKSLPQIRSIANQLAAL